MFIWNYSPCAGVAPDVYGTASATTSVVRFLMVVIRMAEANLDVVKVRAEAAKASVAINAIAEPLVAKPRIKLKLQDLTQSGQSQREQTNRDLAAFGKAVREIKSKIHDR